MSLPAPIQVNAWSPDQLAFQAWLATPVSAREPKTQKALAAMLEVHEATLCDWKKVPGFNDAVYALALPHVVGELVPVLHAQVREAKKGSLPHAQWLFELAGKWNPKSVHEHQGAGGGPLEITIEVVDDRQRPDIRTLE